MLNKAVVNRNRSDDPLFALKTTKRSHALKHSETESVSFSKNYGRES